MSNSMILGHMEYDRLFKTAEDALSCLELVINQLLPKLSDSELYEFYKILDPEEWDLLKIVKDITGTKTSDLYYEDNMGMFELMNGSQLINIHEKLAFAEQTYEIVPGTGYEKTIFEPIDFMSNSYLSYLEVRTEKLRTHLLNLSSIEKHEISPNCKEALVFLINTTSVYSS